MLGQSEKAARTDRAPAREKTTPVKFTKSVVSVRYDFVEGEIAELAPDFAKEMIAHGYAERA